MSRHLRDLLDELIQQIADSVERLDQRHYRLLLNLSAIEKHTLATAATEWSWNVGSPIVMKYLQKAHILNMSDVIVFAYNQNAESAQLIFNDLLETEHMLLADLLKHANSNDPTGIAMCDLLTEGFKRLCNDIIENPDILVKNYLAEVEEFLQSDTMEEIRLMHVKLLLSEGPKQSTAESLRLQAKWNDDTTENAVFNEFLSSVVGCRYHNLRSIVEIVFDNWLEWQSQSWKYRLILLRLAIDPGKLNTFTNDERNEFKSITKKFLKETFKSAVEMKDDNGFHVLFLIARQITRFNESLLGNYATWFKDTIGEMKYLLKNDEFTITIEKLARIVELESDPTVLDVHITVYIPAAPRCNELVLNYKQLCRSRQMHLKNKENFVLK